MKYRCKQDIVLFDHVLAEKNQIVEVGQVLSNGPISVNIDNDFVENTELFETYIDSLLIKTKEFSDEAEEIEKDWIIELKLTTTRKKLRRIENFLNSEVQKFL